MAQATTLLAVELDDRYSNQVGRIYLNGTQALVRLLLAQRIRDEAAGLNTGGFVSGYRGSPLGGFDRELWRAKDHLSRQHIHFWPGINEDLAATAVWGSQMNEHHGSESRYDGVFGMWYGKGAGLDRCGDVMRHAHGAGTSPRGGVLAVVGDDHAQKSSTHPYASEPTFADLLMPVLYPADVGEIIDFGLLGWAMSRATGAWVGLKTLAENLDCSMSIENDMHALRIVQPTAAPSAGGVHFRWPDPWPAWEARTVGHKLGLIHAFARVNGIDRTVLDAGDGARMGIVATGKAYGDVRQALLDLGIDEQQAVSAGLRILKVGMPWPLDPETVTRFAEGLDQILVVEEKRPLLEGQIKDILYGSSRPPVVTGKLDRSGRPQFSWIGEITPDDVAQALGPHLTGLGVDAVQARLASLDAKGRALARPRPSVARPPYFCSGCPHNTSTKVPEGSRAIAGVGCHYMAASMDRSTETFSQMGGEGATWIGQAPFTKRSHVFVNLGEGTYFHSGSLAVRACIAAGVNVTYKLLFNDAVAMTGGQPVDGQLTVPMLARQLLAEGVKAVHVVAEEPERFTTGMALPDGVGLHDRKQLDTVQRLLREQVGVTALIYDQTCAAEKRRRRKRKELPDPPRRAFINDRVCEGCGDCSRASNCLSVVPLDTEWGRKRKIDQSSCNKDLSCVDGFCPSFVTVHGGQLRRPKLPSPPPVPDPVIPTLDRPWNMFVAGVGGTGVVTVGALIGMAAHLEGRSCAVLDQMGMAQKGGAVVTHIRLGPASTAFPSVRVPTACADLLLGCDLVVATTPDAVRRIQHGATRVIANTHETITGEFTRDPDLTQPTSALIEVLEDAAGPSMCDVLDATSMATRLTGDAIGTNLFLLGYAFQNGLVPLSIDALMRAIELNGVAVAVNKSTFAWGRHAVADLAATVRLAGLERNIPKLSALDDEIVARETDLVGYQSAGYARSYGSFVRRVAVAEAKQTPGQTGLAHAVARALYRVMAYKDEYEVARLYSLPSYRASLAATFDGDYRLKLHLAPPLLSKRDPQTGHLRKRAFGPWVFGAFRVISHAKILRGTALDPFGWTAERRMERALINEYRATMEEVVGLLTPANHALAMEIAAVPEAMRGFGHVKEANVERARRELSRLLGLLRQPPSPSTAKSLEIAAE